MITHVPEQITAPRLKQIFPYVRRGDADAREEMIHGFMRLIIYTVKTYSIKDEELFSVGMESLIKCVYGLSNHKMASNHTYETIARYLVVYVRGYLKLYVEHQMLKEELYDPNRLNQLSREDDFSDVIIRDYLEHPTFTKREREIINFKLSGYDSIEIGAELEVSGAFVRQELQKIKPKILKLLEK